MFLAGLAHYLVDRHYHPEAASAASLEKLLAYFGAFLNYSSAIASHAAISTPSQIENLFCSVQIARISGRE